MLNLGIYKDISARLSRDITNSYSTSFSAATKLLEPDVREAIVAIYGFVRVADEVVDTWRPAQMESYINDLGSDLKRAVRSGFSTNPIVQSFALAIIKYNIPLELVEAFLKSMKMDITKKTYNQAQYQQYIYGSAEVVGLMCLMVFVGGNKRLYSSLLSSAKALGSAFQKINFLRDVGSDNLQLGRLYFPGIQGQLDDEAKNLIVEDINQDLVVAKTAIKKLPKSSRYGVELAYRYFAAINQKMSRRSIEEIRNNRISLAKPTKLKIYCLVALKQLVAS
jgi:phytoene/squalene synthetase